jgi:CHASE4 domain
MMLLSRFWYAILSVLVGISIYIVFVAVGQYNRRLQVAMTEEIAGDSQVVRWALQIDARRRLDALLVGSVDKGVQDSLVGANNGKDKVPPKSKEDARKALEAILGKIPPDYKPDALFAVDRDGRVVAQLGYDAANTLDDFELGGYPAVYDALHGFLRDDTWVLGGRMYRVSARPVEYDVSQPPAGAIVGLRLVDARFAQDISKLTRTNVAFYASGTRVSSFAGAGDEGFDERMLEQVTARLPELELDKVYKDTGRSGLRQLNATTGAMYARFDGDAYAPELRAGYAVARSRVSISGPMGFLTGADDKDKQTVPKALIAVVVLLAILFGIGFSFLEHTLPMGQMAQQAARLKKGEIDLLQLARFRGGYRPIAQDLNAGIERVAEKGGGAPRKQADLESILGPVPAQPSMSAFSFPMPGDQSPSMSPARITGPGMPPPSGSRPGLLLNNNGGVAQSGAPGPAGGPQRPPPPFGREAPSRPGLPPPVGFPAREAPSKPNFMPVVDPIRPPPSAPQMGAIPGPGHAGLQRPNASPKPAPPPPQPAPWVPNAPPKAPIPDLAGEEDRDEATKIAAVSTDVMTAASGQHRGQEAEEWLAVYEDFIRTKKQCGESTDGLTFEKFQHTLKKNRDALMQRHGCKRVRFTVYVKEGRASLKATPVKE